MPYFISFCGLTLLACAIGMISAIAVSLNASTSDRCLFVHHEGTSLSKAVSVKQLSHQYVVSGGFGVVGACFALLLVALVLCCQEKENKIMYVILLLMAAAGLAVIGGLQLSQMDKPIERGCFDKTPAVAKFGEPGGVPGLEIAGTIVSGFTIIGLLSVACCCCCNKKS